MRKFLIMLAMLSLASPALANVNFNLLLGSKALESSDWAPVEDQGLLGLHFDGTPAGWPVAFSVDLIGTGKEGYVYYGSGRAKLTGTTSEYDLGVRRYVGDVNNLSAFFGGGVGLIGAKAEVKDPFLGNQSEEDSALGLWLNGGVMARVLGNVNVGAELRWSRAEVTLFDTTTDAGGVAFAFFVGYGF